MIRLDLQKTSRFLRRCAIAAAIVVAACVCVSTLAFDSDRYGAPAPRYAADGTSVNAACYSDAAFDALLEREYPHVAEAFMEDGPASFVIPGLDRTITLRADDPASSPAFCEEMVPQGLAVSVDTLYISAYCETEEHCSVIWILDRYTGDYRKTVVLPGTPHAGGLAWAPESRGLWVTTNQDRQGGSAQVSLIDASALESYDAATDCSPIDYVTQIDLPELPAASSLYFTTYPTPNLLVSCFREFGTSEVVRYELTGDGRSVRPAGSVASSRDVEGLGDDREVFIWGGMQKTQGLCVDGGLAYASLSWGARDSNLIVMESWGGWNHFTDRSLIARVELPAYLEQVACAGDEFYLLFETGASKYRDRDVPLHTNRVLKVSITKLMRGAV